MSRNAVVYQKRHGSFSGGTKSFPGVASVKVSIAALYSGSIDAHLRSGDARFNVYK